MRKTKKQMENEKLLDLYLRKLMQEPEKKDRVIPKEPFWGIFEGK